MRRVSQLLMSAGALLGAGVAAAMAAHLGAPGASWIINVALAKLTLVAAGGLLASGAMVGRMARRRALRELHAPPRHDER
ncbi:MAG TPA: hypothetical protein VGD77_17830 [Gemmatimonadaceae bacterium]